MSAMRACRVMEVKIHALFSSSPNRSEIILRIIRKVLIIFLYNINRLTPNDPYMGRTAPLTSKRYILYIYSTNIRTEYFKHALYPPFFLFKMQFVS